MTDACSYLSYPQYLYIQRVTTRGRGTDELVSVYIGLFG